jgi:hypothetical protein
LITNLGIIFSVRLKKEVLRKYLPVKIQMDVPILFENKSSEQV